MKKIENSFVVSGYVSNDAQIRSFETASVARFSIAVSRSEKKGEETVYTSAFLPVEAWVSVSAVLHCISLYPALSLLPQINNINYGATKSITTL